MRLFDAIKLFNRYRAANLYSAVHQAFIFDCTPPFTAKLFYARIYSHNNYIHIPKRYLFVPINEILILSELKLSKELLYRNQLS